MKFSQFASAEGRRAVADKLNLFENVIARLEEIYNIRPFGQQSAQSLLELWLLVVTTRPRTHWSGRRVAGFGEVQHLVEWMNRGCIDFWRPGDELEKFGLGGNDSCLIAMAIPAETGVSST